MQKKLTEGNITKSIISFMIPILIGNGLQRVYTLVDTMMVGRLLGTAQLAAVGSASVVANLFIDLCSTFTSGFAIVIAQFYGANDEKRMKKALGGTYILSFVISFILMIAGFLLTKPILGWTKVPEEIMDLSISYLRVMIGGLVFTLIYNMMANILRAIGDSSIPLIFLVTSVALNIGFDYISIAWFNLGVTGVAGATILAQGIAGCSCVIFCLFKRKILFVSKSDFIPDVKIYKMILSQGFAMALMLSLVSLSTLILQTGINSLGKDMIAGYLAGRKYLELFMMPGAALAMTSANFVSQNFGAKLFERIKIGVNRILIIDFIWSFISFAIIYVFGRQIIISVTGSNVSEEIISSGIKYMRIAVWFFIPLALLCVLRSALQGMNHKKTAIFSSFIELSVKIIAVGFFVPLLGFIGICITEPLIWLINGLWIYPVYVVKIRKMIKKGDRPKK